MQVITGERIAIAVEAAHNSATQVTRSLDFDFGAREGAVINRVEITQICDSVASDSAQQIYTALSMDPDDTAELATTLATDGVDMDSNILAVLMSLFHTRTDDGAGGGPGFQSHHSRVWDWTHRHPAERPLIVRNLLMMSDQSETDTVDHICVVRYQLVQLSLNELGYINATRR